MPASTIAFRQGPFMKIGSRLYKRSVSQDGHVKNGLGQIESRRRVFLIDERCAFIEPVKLYLDHPAHDGRY
jgi:hypothetical protein